MPTLFNGCGFGPPKSFTTPSSWSWVDHPVSGLRDLTFGLFALAFTSAPYLRYLTSPDPATRRTVLQKVRRCTVKIVLRQFVNTGFQVLFHSPPGVLFTFPSQYYALSVTEEYLALRGGPRSFPQGFPCLVVLWIPARSFSLRLRGFHSLWREFPFASPQITVRFSGPNPGVHALRFGLFQFRSPLLSKSHVVFSSSGYLDVSVHRVPFIRLCIYRMMTEVFSAGFPHSDICGSRLICSSPQLFAAYHVFPRLSVPRHPPCALSCLTCFPIISV